MRKYFLAASVTVVIVIAVLVFTGQKSVENEMPVIFTTGEMLTSPTGLYIKEINSGRRCEELAGATDFIIFGDTQPRNEEDWEISEQVVDSIATTEHEFIVHVGDHVEHSNSDAEWDRYFNLIAPIYKKDKYFAVVGNHDAPAVKNGMWQEYWDLPNNERWYSFDRESSHFIVLDNVQGVNHWGNLGSEQEDWLREDLQTCERAEFCFVFMHVPPVSWNEPLALHNEPWLNLLKTHGADAIFAGHIHNYERGNYEDIGSVTTGGGGNKFHKIQGVPSADKTLTKTNHFVKVSATSDRTVGCIYSIDGKTLDSFEILKR
tara:strand:- start:2980 stop:3933 length:954 start_codon:yes stop_codon:yes gene_type:complete